MSGLSRAILQLLFGAFAIPICSKQVIANSATQLQNPFENMTTQAELAYCGGLLRAALLDEVGEEKLKTWFNTLDVEQYSNGVLTASVPVKFVRDWINVHCLSDLQNAARRVHPLVARVRQTGFWSAVFLFSFRPVTPIKLVPLTRVYRCSVSHSNPNSS